MKLSDIKDQIQTGDLVLVDGTGFVSDAIKELTNGRFSHVGIFFRLTEKLRQLFIVMKLEGDWINAKEGNLCVGEMWYGKSFDVHLVSQCVSLSDGTCYLGVAPWAVRSQPDKVLAEVEHLVRTQPVYGLKEFPLILADHVFGTGVDPETIAPVCSIAAELCYIPCGVKFQQEDADPSDFDSIVAGTMKLELS